MDMLMRAILIISCVTFVRSSPLHGGQKSGHISGCPAQCSCTWQRTYSNSQGEFDELEVLCNRYAAKHDADLSASPNMSNLKSHGKPVRLTIEQTELDQFTAISLSGQKIKSLKLMHNSKLRKIDPDVFVGLADVLETLIILGNPSLIDISFDALSQLKSLRTLKLQLINCPDDTESEEINITTIAPDVADIENSNSKNAPNPDVSNSKIAPNSELSYDELIQQQKRSADPALQSRRRLTPNQILLSRLDQIPEDGPVPYPGQNPEYPSIPVPNKDIEKPPAMTSDQLDPNAICESAIPNLVSQMMNLQNLHLQGTRFKSSFQGIADLKSILDLTLTHMGLMDEDFKDNPKFFDHLSQLELLSLADNQLTAVPASLQKAAQLQTLSLENNRLLIDYHHPNWSVLTVPPQLETLDIRGNDYKTFPCGLLLDPSSRLHLPKLRYLKMDNLPESLCLTCQTKVAFYKQTCRRQDHAGNSTRSMGNKGSDQSEITRTQQNRGHGRTTSTRRVPKLALAVTVNPADYFYE